MHVRIIQHVEFEQPGLIAEWAAERGYELTVTRAWVDELPEPTRDDLLVVLGGPMSANDDAVLPWLRPEKLHIAEAIAAGGPVLGVCLGAQIVATVIGGSVRRNREVEIGWYPVMPTPEAAETPLFAEWPAGAIVGHWHGDTFDLPEGMETLLSSEHCRNQAFVFDDRVVGIQFHLEWTEPLLAAMIEACASEFDIPGHAIMSASDLLGGLEAEPEQRRALLFALLDRLAQTITLPAEEPAHA